MNPSNAVLTQLRRQNGGMCADTEGKYEKIYRDRAELDEINALNRRIEERTAYMQSQIWEQEKKAERRRDMEAQRVNSMLKLIGTLVVSATVIAAAAALYLTEAVQPWLAAGIGGSAGLIGAFRFGYLWNNVSNFR